FLRLILGVAVALLQTAGELLAPALDDFEIVLGELAPLLLGFAFELLPVSFDSIPIHLMPPLSFDRWNARRTRELRGWFRKFRRSARRPAANACAPKHAPEKAGA